MSTRLTLGQLGWDSFFEERFKFQSIPGLVPGRVISQEREGWLVLTEAGELDATITGKLRMSGERFPVTGDWVAVQPLPGEARGIIHDVLPRETAVTRQASGGRERLSGGRTVEQLVAANVDVIFVVSGLDGGRNYNLRRMERYLTLAWNSGAGPVILLNKADLCADIDRFVLETEAIAPGVPLYAVSALQGTGLGPVKEHLGAGVTAAFVGPSGVGKSALINALLGYERQQTGTIRASDREGRHTTTRRELIILPSGGMVIDTPGIRELKLWTGEGGFDAAFSDIEELAQQCRFPDCRHDAEPGCAVKAAVERGELDYDRLDSYHKLRRELRRQAARTDESIRMEEKSRVRQFSKMIRNFEKKNRKY